LHVNGCGNIAVPETAISGEFHDIAKAKQMLVLEYINSVQDI
jgi:hypothetical protein